MPGAPLTVLSLADRRSILRDVRELTVGVGAEILRLRAGLMTQTSKGGVDMVTAADVHAETLLTDGLARLFPGHRIAAEEGTRRGPADSPWIWHVDPLDGTANFSRGLPYWMHSVGLSYGDTPVLGVLHGPECGLTVWGGDQVGGFFATGSGEEPLVPATPPGEPKTWIVATDWPWDLDERQRTNRLIDHLSRRVRQYKSLGSAAVDLSHVALGRVDGYCISKIFPWDQAAGAAICAALGYELRRWDGSPWDLRHQDIAVCRPGMWPVLADGLSAESHT